MNINAWVIDEHNEISANRRNVKIMQFIDTGDRTLAIAVDKHGEINCYQLSQLRITDDNYKIGDD